MTLDVSIIISFLIINILLGFWTARHTNNLNQFSVGHRAFGTFAIFATLSASFIGGGYTIGNAAKVFEIGMIYPIALLGFSLKEIGVALFIAPRMDKHRDCLSIGDIMAKRYGQGAKIVTGIFAVLICAGILGAQVGAMGAIFNRFFSLSPTMGILIGFSIIIFYATLGGMRAVVYTDILQFCILIIGIPLTFFIGLHMVGGWQALTTQVTASHLQLFHTHQSVLMFISLFLTFMLGETLVPPYVQRLFMAKTAIHTSRGTLYSGLLSIPFFLITGAIGLIAYALNPSLDPNTAIPFVVETALPIAVKGFVISGIIAIIMSSASGFLNAGAVSFVNDVVKPIWGSRLSEPQLFSMAKLGTTLIGFGSVFFALMITNVLDILLYAYQFWAPVILIPLLAVLFDLPVKAKHFTIGATCGLVMSVVWSWGLSEPYQINTVVVGVLANALAFFSSYFLDSDSAVAEPAN